MEMFNLANPISPVPAVVSLLVAMATAALFWRRFGVEASSGRYASIDGLRGFLAFLVFLHHSAVWFFYLKTGKWTTPPSNLYTYFGQGSVAFFFMITGFLFFSKLLEGRKKPVDWLKLFVSRIMRLFPMYLFSIALLLFVVFYAAGGALIDPLPVLLKNIIRWIGFTIKSAPDLNGVKNTYIVVAGVFWSLPYEWLFYLCLPLLSLLLIQVPPWPYVLLGLACLGVFLYIGRIKLELLTPFVGGMLAAFFVKSNGFCEFASKKLSSLLIVICVVSAVAFYDSAWTTEAVILLSIAFIFIACGNTLLGVLIHPISRVLGEMAYSIYLLHGMILFVLFNYIIGWSVAAEFSALAHWLWIIGVTPAVVILSFITFHLIEAPGMRATPLLVAWLRLKPLSFSKGLSR